MRFSRWLVITVFAVGYGSLLSAVWLADQRAREFNNPDGDYYLRTGYNPVFHPGEYVTPTNLPILFPANAHMALAQQAANDGKLDQAKQHAYTALKASPANGSISLMLLELYTRPNLYRVILPSEEDIANNTFPPQPDRLAYAPLDDNGRQIAESLAHIADTIRPSYTMTQGPLSSYWNEQGKPEKAIKGWSTLLSFSLSNAADIFPKLHAAMGKAEVAAIIQSYADSPPKWWDAFFSYLLEHETDPQKILDIYQARKNSNAPLTPAERNAYVSYLIKQNRWNEAHQVWVDNMVDIPEPAALRLFDGSFENNEDGAFAWNLQQLPGITVRRDYSSGITGKQALRIGFRSNKSIMFRHVAQVLVLPPGNYTLTGRYRMDQLITDKGLRWRIYCNSEVPTLLGQAEPLKGQSDWETFEQNFNIPAECKSQILRLESDSIFPHENVFSGEVWFDDMSITVLN